jgi:hypothetical protein
MIVWNNGNYLTTQNSITEYLNLQQQCSDDLKSHILYPHIIIIELFLLFSWAVEETCSLLDSLPLMMGPIGCPDTSVRNHHHSLHNNPDEGSSHQLLGGSLKSHMVQLVCMQDLNWGLPSPLVCCIVFVIIDFLVSFKELSSNLICHSLHMYACFSVLNGKYSLMTIYKVVQIWPGLICV